MPMLPETCAGLPSMSTGSASTSSSFSATIAPASSAWPPGCTHGELVAAQACQQVGVAQYAAHALGHLAQQRVAAGVAEGIVDLLEVVQVDQVQEQQLVMALAAGGHVHQAPIEFGAVRQAGQGVDVGQARMLVLAQFLLGGIAHDLHVTDVAPGLRHHRVHHAVAPEELAVLAHVPAEIASAAVIARLLHFQ